MMSNPIVKPTILLSPVENGYVAYDPTTDQLHQLNPVAALIVELCDGRRSVDEIQRLLAPLLPGGSAGEIGEWIGNALKAGVLVPSEGLEGNFREFSADELYELVWRLKENGNMQTAYICGKKLVELEPQDWWAWYMLSDLCLYVGKREEARDALQKYFNANPNDAEIEHLLFALKDETPPERASDRTIQSIYKGFSKTYDGRMRDDLKYNGPEHLLESIKSVIGDARGLHVLDLGCGSGFTGMVLKPLAARLIGVDLSPEMIELARKREVYGALENGEITEWLEQSGECFDLVSCCDCLIYFGDLKRIIAAAAKRLKPGGIFAFTTESGPKFPFRLTDTGRYEHHPDHIRDAAAAAGLSVAVLDQSFLRFEYGAEVIANYAVLSNGPATAKRLSNTKSSESLVAN